MDLLAVQMAPNLALPLSVEDPLLVSIIQAWVTIQDKAPHSHLLSSNLNHLHNKVLSQLVLNASQILTTLDQWAQVPTYCLLHQIN